MQGRETKGEWNLKEITLIGKKWLSLLWNWIRFSRSTQSAKTEQKEQKGKLLLSWVQKCKGVGGTEVQLAVL